MEITKSSIDTYEPSMDDQGNYVDNINLFKGSIRCPCKDTIFTTKSSFKTHMTTNVHSNWLNTLNLNKNNHLIQNISMKEELKSLKKILTEKENKISKQKTKIKSLENKIQTLKDVITDISALKDRDNKKSNFKDIDLLDLDDDTT